jgi:polyhydroxyalkanoate synthesis regulator phasin
MSDGAKDSEQRGLSEALRTAIERTFAATADSAAETRERAQELLDEVTRRGQEAREAVTRRGQEAQEASAGAAARVVEAIEGMRLPSREELRAIEQRLDELSERVAALEAKSKVEG